METIMHFRTWSFRDFAILLAESGAKVGAEIGVYNGERSDVLYRHLNLDKFYLIDSYIPYNDKSINDSQEVCDARYNLVCTLFRNTKAEIIRKKSRDAINDVPDNSLDFVYIDADHNYKEVKWDIDNWTKKVHIGGVVAGHDFHDDNFDVKKALYDYCRENNVKEFFVFEHDNIWVFKKEAENE